jgi:hypothetical protein
MSHLDVVARQKFSLCTSGPWCFPVAVPGPILVNAAATPSCLPHAALVHYGVGIPVCLTSTRPMLILGETAACHRRLLARRC